MEQNAAQLWFERYLELRLADPRRAARHWAEAAAELRERFAPQLAELSRLGLLEPAPAAAPLPEPEAPPGYRLLEPLGAGATSTVYAAERLGLGRQVAIKFLRPGAAADAQGAERFRREAQGLARLRERHVVTIHDYGVVGERPFLVLERLHGPSLAELLPSAEDLPGSGELRRRVGWCAALAGALHALHGAGFVHRDVKPANVMLDRGGEPVLIDLGAALDLGPEVAERTQTGLFLGTPAFAAPEQLEGRRCDPRTDVYGLGATLFRLLAPVLPVDAGTVTQMVSEHRRRGPRQLRSVNRQVDRVLSGIVRRALATDPRDRYPTCAALGEDLSRWLRGARPRAARSSPLWTTWFALRRHRVAAVLAALMLAVLTLGRQVAVAAERERSARVAAQVENLWRELDTAIDVRDRSGAAQVLDELERHVPWDTELAFTAVRIQLLGPGNFDPGWVARSPEQVAELDRQLARAEPLLKQEPCWPVLLELRERIRRPTAFDRPALATPPVSADGAVERRTVQSLLLLDSRDLTAFARGARLFRAQPADVRFVRMVARNTVGADQLVSLAAAGALRSLRPEEPGAASGLLLSEARYLQSLRHQLPDSEESTARIDSALQALREQLTALAAQFPNDRKVLFDAAWLLQSSTDVAEVLRSIALYQRSLEIREAPEARKNLANAQRAVASQLQRAAQQPRPDPVGILGCSISQLWRRHLLALVLQDWRAIESYDGAVAGHWSLRGWLVGEVEGPLQAVAELTLGLERCAVEADLWQLHLLRAEYALDQLERHPVDVGLAAEVRESLTWLSRAEFAVEPERYSRIFRSAGRLGDPDLARALWNRLDAQQQGQAATLYANFLAPLLDREGH